jgi:hypothetical protein
MTWRGRSGPTDRLYSCLFYLLPMAEASVFGAFLFQQAPILLLIYAPFIWLHNLLSFPILGGVGISLSFVVFFCIFILVVRNQRLLHFLRFNAMQALLLDIAIFLGALLISLLSFIVPESSALQFIVQTLATTIFIGVSAAFIYCVVQCIRGLYAEIPGISDAAYYSTRF